MEINKYNDATELLNNIKHIDEVLDFINEIKNTGTTIRMEESGFVSRPKNIVLKKLEFDFLIESYKDIKKKLEQEFTEL